MGSQEVDFFSSTTTIPNHHQPKYDDDDSSDSNLPYWQVNVPPKLRTAQCPDFLLNLTEKDRGIISTPDRDYEIDSWAVVRSKVARNRLDLFQRKPSDLRRYLRFTWALKQEHGSVMNFILSRRLNWVDVVASSTSTSAAAAAGGGGGGVGGQQQKPPTNNIIITPKGRKPFDPETEEEDVKILRNDWPYGIDERIVHLVVWTKFALEDDERTGDLTDQARREIDEWVNKKFGARVGRENVIWFKNWAFLKSVKAVEHFHVMLFNPDMKFVDEVTGGDVPLCERV